MKLAFSTICINPTKPTRQEGFLYQTKPIYNFHDDLYARIVSFENEDEFGKVEDVQDYGAAEVFFVKTKSNKQLMFPNVKGVIVSFDYKTKKLVLNKDKFKEVCDYED